jgi:hypothetical protein
LWMQAHRAARHTMQVAATRASSRKKRRRERSRSRDRDSRENKQRMKQAPSWQPAGGETEDLDPVTREPLSQVPENSVLTVLCGGTRTRMLRTSLQSTADRSPTLKRVDKTDGVSAVDWSLRGPVYVSFHPVYSRFVALRADVERMVADGSQVCRLEEVDRRGEEFGYSKAGAVHVWERARVVRPRQVCISYVPSCVGASQMTAQSHGC